EGWSCVGLSAEHTHLSRDDGDALRIGDRVEMIPHYSDSTVLLHRALHAHRAGVVEEAWEISGSGALQ
ncbi:MAG: DSD1 family PLP-dependent enzyme, partial [Chloroflexi bacterium]|nr:DSD1 family PLP-dependent enzyme [Chloroflexota bacterium]